MQGKLRQNTIQIEKNNNNKQNKIKMIQIWLEIIDDR